MDDKLFYMHRAIMIQSSNNNNLNIWFIVTLRRHTTSIEGVFRMNPIKLKKHQKTTLIRSIHCDLLNRLPLIPYHQYLVLRVQNIGFWSHVAFCTLYFAQQQVDYWAK